MSGTCWNCGGPGGPECWDCRSAPSLRIRRPAAEANERRSAERANRHPLWRGGFRYISRNAWPLFDVGYLDDEGRHRIDFASEVRRLIAEDERAFEAAQGVRRAA